MSTLNASHVTAPTKDPQKSLSVALGNRLMQNHEPGMPVSPGQHFEVVQDGRGQPIILSLGNDHRLWLIHRAGDGASGWSQVDLTASLGDIVAQAFAASQGPDGAITLAVAVARSAKDRTSTVYATAPLDPAKTDWGSFGAWKPRPRSTAGDVEIRQLLIGPGEGGAPAIVAAGDSAGGSTYFLISLDLGTTEDLWHELPPPTDAVKVIDVAMGRIAGVGPGLYTLYRGNAGTQLVFTSYPLELDTGWSRPVSRRLKAPPGAHDLAVGPGDAETTELFVGGTGVWRFAPDGQKKDAEAVEVHGTKALGDVVAVIVRADAQGNTALWSLVQDQTLHYQLRAAGSPAWSAPVPLHKGTGQIAALRSSTRITNELFTVDGDGSLNYLWQDPRSTVWQASPMVVHDTGKIVEGNTYTYQVRITDPESGVAPPDLSLQLTASDWCYATVNGVACVLDAVTPITAQPDASGLVTIVFKTETMDVPSITVRSDAIDGVLMLDGGSDLRDRIAKMSKEELGSATYSSGPSKGQKVVPSQHAGNVAAAADSLKMLHRMAPSRLFLRAGDVSLLAPAPRVHEEWGVVLSERGATFHAGAEARRHLHARLQGARAAAAGPADFSDAIVTVAGDVLRALMDGWNKVSSFFVTVIEDVASFVVEVGGKLLRFALDSLAVVGRAFSWVLKELLGVDLEKVIQWLGFVFDWEDIKRSARALVNMTNQTLIWTEGQIPRLAAKVDGAFADLESRLRSLAPVGGSLGDLRLNGRAREAGAGSPVISDALGGDPAVGYASYHMQHSGVLGGGPSTSTRSDALSAFVDDVMRPAVESLAGTFSALGQDLHDLFTSDSLTPDQMLARLGVDALVGMVDAIRAVVVGLVKLLGEVLGTTRHLFNAKLDIPFLSALYRKFVGGDLTFLDGFALLVAVPATILFKILFNRAPISSDSDPLLTEEAKAAFADPPRHGALAAEGDYVFGGSWAGPWNLWGGVVGVLAMIAETLLTFRQRSELLKPEDKRSEELVTRLSAWKLLAKVLRLVGAVPFGKYEHDRSELEYIGYGLEWASAILGAVFLHLTDRVAFSTERLEGLATCVLAVCRFVVHICTVVAEGQVPSLPGGDIALTLIENILTDASEMFEGVSGILMGTQPWLLIVSAGATGGATIVHLVRLVMAGAGEYVFHLRRTGSAPVAMAPAPQLAT